jgi:hypothetical protein
MEPIKKIYPYHENILIIDSENKLWVMGDNKYRRTGFGKLNKPIYTPVYSGIILDSDEMVDKFYVCGHLLSIYTTKKRLFVSRFYQKNKNQHENLSSSRMETPVNTIAHRTASRRRDARRNFLSARSHRHGRNDNRNGNIIDIDDNDVDDNDVDDYEVDDNDVDDNYDDEDDNISHEESFDNVLTSSQEELLDRMDNDEINGEIDGDADDEIDVDGESNEDSSDGENTESRQHHHVNGNVMGIYMPRNDILVLAEGMSQTDINALSLNTGWTINGDVDIDAASDENDFDENKINAADDFDNYEFYLKLSNLKYNNNTKQQGIDLLADDVDEVTFASETIFFRKEGKIYVFNRYLVPKSSIFNNLGISLVRDDTDCHHYYHMIFPFDYDKCIFMNNFLYLLCGSYHHIISAYGITTIGNKKTILAWLYFKCDFKINHNDIFYVPIEGTIYIKNKNDIYKYCHNTKTVKLFIDENAKTFIIPTNDGFDNVLFCIKNDGVYFDHGDLEKEIEYHELLPYIIDMDAFYHSQLIIVDTDSPQRYVSSGTSLFFNIHDVAHYKLMNSGIIYYDNSNTLYYCTNETLLESTFNTMEIDKIFTKHDTFYIYMFKNLPTPITNIQFTGSIIILQTENKYYYHTIESNNFKVDKFTEITIKNDPKNLDLVSKHYIIRNKKIFDNIVTLRISKNTNKLKRLMAIIEMLGSETNFDINFIDKTNVVSYGDGPKREFMDAALIDFSGKYLVKNNNCAEYNLEKMASLADDDLVTIGIMLHAVICHSNSYLPIRIPLPLISAILKKNPTIVELEYFAKLEDPEAFNNLYPYKDDDKMIKTFGYDNYEECLKFICKFYHDEDNNLAIEKISKLIATGFNNYNDIKNLAIMNMPTLDYFLSGDYNIDRNLLLKNLVIGIDSSDEKEEIHLENMIIDTIKNLSEEKLAILLKNWSGTSVVKKSNDYNIFISKQSDQVDKKLAQYDIHFATCNIAITIKKQLFSNPETRSLLVDLLTTPINFMLDQ